MQLEGKTAVVYGAGGSVGSAVSKALRDAGATVFLAGRNRESVSGRLADWDDADQVNVAGVDVLVGENVQSHLASIAEQVGKIDIVFNAVTYDDVQGQSLVELSSDVLQDRVVKTVLAQNNVIQACAAHMIESGSGLISTIVGHGQPWPGMGTTMISWGIVEALLRQWAVDLGPKGIRVAWLRTGGFYESIAADRDYGSSYTGDADLDQVIASLKEGTMLKDIPSVDEAGRAAVYLATSERTTACAINLTAGAYSD